MEETKIEEANREFNNLSGIALWESFIDLEQKEYLINNRPNIVICHGRVRNVMFDNISANQIKMHTCKL